MTDREFYEVIGGNYDEVLSRLIKPELIHRFIIKYKTDPSYRLLKEAVATGDIEESFKAAHSLKGVVANLGFTPLFNATYELVEQLRPRTSQADEDLVEKVDECYEWVMVNLNRVDE